jgi:hypothetical protein
MRIPYLVRQISSNESAAKSKLAAHDATSMIIEFARFGFFQSLAVE